MGRKRTDAPSTAPAFDWYLPQWMETLDVNQTELIRRTGWSKTASSDIYNGKTGYSKRLVNEASHALNIRPYELLMDPEEAMALRQMQKEALRVVDIGRKLDRTGTEG